MAVKYLAGNRLWGTDAERLAMTTGLPDWEDTTFTTGWSSGGSPTVSGGIIPVNATGSTYTGMSFDLEQATGLDTTVDGSEWVFQFKIKQTVWSVNTACDYQDGYVLLGDTTSQSGNFAIFHMENTQCGLDVNGYRFGIREDGSLDGGQEGNSATRNFQPTSSGTTISTTQGISGDGQVGIRITRTSSNTFKYEICTDPTFVAGTTAVYNSDDTDVAEAITGMRYIMLGGFKQSSANGSNTCEIDDMKFWNATTSVTPVYPNLPNGATFLTSDTNKLYMWNGTDTWNEVG